MAELKLNPSDPQHIEALIKSIQYRLSAMPENYPIALPRQWCEVIVELLGKQVTR